MEKKEILTLAENICQFLQGWRVDKRDDGDDFIKLIGEHQNKIIILSSSGKKINAFGTIKLNKRCIYGRYQRFGVRIGFSPTRAPHILANDIKRRLLVNYDEKFNIEAQLVKEEQQIKEFIDHRIEIFKVAHPYMKENEYQSIHRFNTGTTFSKRYQNIDCHIHANFDFLRCIDERCINLKLNGLPEELAYQVLNKIDAYAKEKN